MLLNYVSVQLCASFQRQLPLNEELVGKVLFFPLNPRAKTYKLRADLINFKQFNRIQNEEKIELFKLKSK